MSASAVHPVRLALVNLIRARLVEIADSTTEVTYGHPGKNLPSRLIAVCDTDDAGARREQHTLPLRRNSSRTEDFTLRLVVFAGTGESTVDAQQRMTSAAWALADLLDDLARSDTTLGGLVDWALFTRFDDSDFELKEGRAAEIVAYLNVHVTRS